MKTIVLIAALALSASSFAAGYETNTFTKIFWGASEEEVLSKVEASLPTFKEDKELLQSMRFQKCDTHARNIKIGNTLVKKFYRTVDGTLEAKFRAMLIVKNTRCFVSYK